MACDLTGRLKGVRKLWFHDCINLMVDHADLGGSLDFEPHIELLIGTFQHILVMCYVSQVTSLRADEKKQFLRLVEAHLYGGDLSMGMMLLNEMLSCSAPDLVWRICSGIAQHIGGPDQPLSVIGILVDDSKTITNATRSWTEAILSGRRLLN